MGRTIKELIGLVKDIPAEYFEETYEKLLEIKAKSKAGAEKDLGVEKCPHCQSGAIVRNGKRHNKQAYLCRNCGKTFVQTATSAIACSHSAEAVWKDVVRDTINGVSIDQTAESLELSHSTVFHMRHKILSCVEKAILAAPVDLVGVCEADETYILESVKGRKIPEDYHRKPRKHGATASKPGLSNEYICVQTSVNSESQCIASAVNRAAPSKAEILEVFGDRIVDDTVILCDGKANYDVLEDKCIVAHTERINTVNSFHSFIKERIRAARGVATIYLNRYNSLFAKIFGNMDTAPAAIYNLIKTRNSSFQTIAGLKSNNLLGL